MTDPIAVFEKGVDEGVYPGGQLAIAREGRQAVAAVAGFVQAGGAQTSASVIYDLASLTKPLATGVLIGRAMERGLCRLEDPLCRFVPEVPDEITLLHSLEHSTGYPAHLRFDSMLPADVRSATWAAHRHIIHRVATTPREQSVGRTVVYSDLGFILLGAALEKMFNQPISRTFAELGTELFYRDQRGPPAPPLPHPNAVYAPTENCEPGNVHDENCRGMGGAAGHAGLWGTATGVLKIADSLVAAYHGATGGLLQPETVRRLWQPSDVADSTRTPAWDRPSPRGSSTGTRWPSYAVGHLGFTGTSLWIEPQRALIVVLVTNRVCPTRDNTKIRSLRPALHDAVWEKFS